MTLVTLCPPPPKPAKPRFRGLDALCLRGLSVQAPGIGLGALPSCPSEPKKRQKMLKFWAKKANLSKIAKLIAEAIQGGSAH